MFALDLSLLRRLRPKKTRVSDEVRFWSRVTVTDGCWEWDYPRPDGYGGIRIAGVRRPAHRVAYEWCVGPVPAGLVLDHLCLNPACVRPDHLEPVTAKVNVERGMVKKDVCVRGHQLGAGAAWTSNRNCKQCSRERQRRRPLRAM